MHFQVSFYCSLHPFMPRKLNSPLLLYSDFSARFLVQLLLLLYCSAEKPFFGHFGLFNTRHMSDCSSCTQAPWLAIVADMMKIYKKFVSVSNNKILKVPQPYTLPQPPTRRLKSVSSNPRDAYHEICLQQSQS